MDDYLSKPVRSDDLLKTIQRVVNQPKPVDSCSKSDDHPAGGNVVEIFDYDASVALLDGDGELLGELVSVFLGQLPLLLTPLAAAVEAGDAVAIRKTAHSLNSSVSVLVAPRSKHIARKLEMMGLNAELEAARQTHAELLAEFDTLQKALEASPKLKAA